MRKIEREESAKSYSSALLMAAPTSLQKDSSFNFLTKLAQKIRSVEIDSDDVTTAASTPHMQKKYLVLDLDETLIHATGTKPTYPHITVKVFAHNIYRNFFVAVRPKLIEFMEKMKSLYTILIYTASQKEYAEAIVKAVGIKDYIERIYHRDHCTNIHGSIFLKDINCLGVPLNKLVFIDDSIVQVRNQVFNSIHIRAFRGDTEDRLLNELSPFLTKIADVGVEDIRPINQKYQSFINGVDMLSSSNTTQPRIQLIPDFRDKLNQSKISSKAQCKKLASPDMSQAPVKKMESFVAPTPNSPNASHKKLISMTTNGLSRFTSFETPEKPEPLNRIVQPTFNFPKQQSRFLQVDLQNTDDTDEFTADVDEHNHNYQSVAVTPTIAKKSPGIFMRRFLAPERGNLKSY